MPSVSTMATGGRVARGLNRSLSKIHLIERDPDFDAFRPVGLKCRGRPIRVLAKHYPAELGDRIREVAAGSERAPSRGADGDLRDWAAAVRGGTP
jgi:hypothetical protein